MSKIVGSHSILLATLVVFNAGCQKKPVSAVHWPSIPSAAAGKPPAALVVDDRDLRPFRVGLESVVSKRVVVGGAFLRDSWIKNVRDTQGKLIYADGRIYDAVPVSLQKRAQALSATPEASAAILKRLKHDLPALAGSTWIHGPELELSQRERLPGWRLLWVVDYLDCETDAFKRLRASQRGLVVSIQTVSAEYVDAPASVFPKGPKSSGLEDVMFAGLVEGDSLANLRSRVTCSDDPQLIGWDKTKKSFQFSTSDTRFDAVQAFFYVDQAQAWFKAKAGIELPAPLTVDVYAGGNQSPRNTACYYFNIIRLGAGDGKTYRDLMRDPSVVMHEVSHAMIEAISHLSTQDEGGSINEAFADFFAANILDSPHMGEVSYVPGPYKRNLDNDSVLKEKNGGLYHDSLIVSGTLWEIRKTLGPAQGLVYALKVLSRLNADSDFAGFKTASAFAVKEGFGPDEAARIAQVLSRRGW